MVDFVCLSHGLVVELDGQPHEDDWSDYDSRRTEYLEHREYRVVRFENNEVLHYLNDVITDIEQALHTQKVPRLRG